VLIRFIPLVILVGLPPICLGQTSAPGRGPAPATGAGLRPFTLSVVDRETGKPVTEFSYTAAYRAPDGRRWSEDAWRSVKSASGTFVIQVPPVYVLSVAVRSHDIKAGSSLFHEFRIHSTDNVRSGIVELVRGAAVHGTIRDAKTLKPIAGAIVRPRVEYGMVIYGGIEERQAISDRDGHYKLNGVDLEFGVSADHPDYGGRDYSVDAKKGIGPLFDVYLWPVDHGTLRGTVRDANGQPLEGVTVSDNEKHVLTTRDGTYALNRVLGLPGKHVMPPLTFSKQGYVARRFGGYEVSKDGFVVVLQRPAMLEGQVVGPDGRPVTRFAVCAGPGKTSAEDVSLKSVERIVDDHTGRFRLGLDQEGRTWVGVRAEGYATGEAVIDVPRSGGSVVVRLESGARVAGRALVPPGGLANLEARLVLRRGSSDGRGFGSQPDVVEWLSPKTIIAADGSLRFDHVRPDRYTLLLKGPGVTSKMLALDVGPEGLDISLVRLAGRGRIHGSVFEEIGGGPRSFAIGKVFSAPAGCVPREYKEEIEFMSDDKGEFSVGGVPAGLVGVGFPLVMVDTEYTKTQQVAVCEGQVTEMRIFGPVGSHPLTVEVCIGDGSGAQFRSGSGLGDKLEHANIPQPVPGAEAALEPRFRVQLVPRLGKAIASVQSEWVRIDAKAPVVLSDVSPGAYRLQVIRGRVISLFEVKEELLFEQDITVPTKALAYQVSLGGGSIKGRFLQDGDAASEAEVIAMARGGQGLGRRTRCDVNGTYCMRFLRPGAYTLYGYDSEGGWCRVDNVSVASNVTDAGEHRLARGGTVRGSISFRGPCPVPDRIVATGPSQVSLWFPILSLSKLDQFELSNLWPGQWTISVRAGDEVLATANTEIRGTGTTNLELQAELEAHP
jgi:hypothetical protein